MNTNYIRLLVLAAAACLMSAEVATPQEGCEADTTPPAIDHERMCDPKESMVNSGYIDPRRESLNGHDLNLGIASVTLIFTEPVFDVGSAVDGTEAGFLTPASFTITQTGADTPTAATSNGKALSNLPALR